MKNDENFFAREKRSTATEGHRTKTLRNETPGMWCRCCHQDVPAVATIGDPSRVRCARCGEVMNRRDREMAMRESAGVTAAPAAAENADAPQVVSPSRSSDWRLEDELREAQRLVDKVRAGSGRPNNNELGEQPTATPARQAPVQSQAESAGGSTLSWSLSGLGLSGLVCGCALLVWSLVADRAELWTIGLPIALVSQVVLICGVLLRRDGSVTTAKNDGSASSATYVQVQASNGAMQPSGLSVHFSSTVDAGRAMNTDQLRREIEAVMQRQRAA